MKKNYYYLYGTQNEDLPGLAKLLFDKLDLEFDRHESDYLGEYFKYAGIYADKITLERNFNSIEDSWKEEAFKEYPTLLYVSNITGKNTDKLSKSKYLEEAFPQVAGMKLLRGKIIESND